MNNLINKGINENSLNTYSIQSEDNKPYFIYNIDQANFFMQNEITAIGTSFGSKGDLYIKFPKTIQAKEVMQKWINLNKAK